MRESHDLAGTAKKVLLSLVVGTCVFGTAYVAAWLGVRDVPALTSHRWVTQIILRELHDAVEQHRKATGALPAAMENLAAAKERRLETDAKGRVLDRWGHPVAYSQTDGGFEIWSYGRDGRAGGVGLDADLSADGRGYDNSLPTLRQFAFELNTRGILGACLASGLLAVAMYHLLARDHNLGRDGSRKVLARMLVTFVFSLIVAAGLVVLYTPSGH